jgi:hypothetical protein
MGINMQAELDMQHGPRHAVLAWTCFIDLNMQHGHGRATWTWVWISWNIIGHAPWTWIGACSMDMDIDMGMDMDTDYHRIDALGHNCAKVRDPVFIDFI